MTCLCSFEIVVFGLPTLAPKVGMMCFFVDCVDLSELSRCYAKILCKPSLSGFSLLKLPKTPTKFLSVTKLSHDFLGVYREEIILGKDSPHFVTKQ
jgi:hypothetical protein